MDDSARWESSKRWLGEQTSRVFHTRRLVDVLRTRCEDALSQPKTSREPRELEAATELKMEAQRCQRWRKRGRGQAKRKGREEKREEIAQLSDAQITMQIPTDRQRGRVGE
jgi:hypothetical protein